jgi:uncharacterized protein
MRRIGPAAALAAGITALSPSSALAADDASGNPGETEIHLDQTAARTMAPDRLRAVMRIEARGSAARQVQSDVNRRMAAALDKAKSFPAVKAETGAYTVNRSFNAKDRELWQATQTLSLASPDFEAVLSLIGDLQTAGLLMSGLQFFVAPETLRQAESDLTAAALDGLQTRAAEVAKDLGMAIGHYKTITIGNASAPVLGRAQYMMQGPAMAGAPVQPPAAQAGDATVSLSVNAAIVLVPSKS